jgi:hypothetical protein
MEVFHTEDGKPSYITAERIRELDSKPSILYQTVKDQDETIYADLSSTNQSRGKEGEVL